MATGKDNIESKYQTIQVACEQVREHFATQKCSIEKEDYDNKILVKFHETKDRNAFRFTIDKDKFTRKSRLKDHLEHIARLLKENGKI